MYISTYYNSVLALFIMVILVWVLYKFVPKTPEKADIVRKKKFIKPNSYENVLSERKY